MLDKTLHQISTHVNHELLFSSSVASVALCHLLSVDIFSAILFEGGATLAESGWRSRDDRGEEFLGRRTSNANSTSFPSPSVNIFSSEATNNESSHARRNHSAQVGIPPRQPTNHFYLLPSPRRTDRGNRQPSRPCHPRAD